MPLSLRLSCLIAAGAAAGLHLPFRAPQGFAFAAAAAVCAAWLARRRGHRGPMLALWGMAVVAGTAAWAIHVVRATERPTLVRWLEGRTSNAEDGGAASRDAPVRVRGTIERDAAATPYGAQFPLAASAIEVEGAWVPLSGGVTVSVAGQLLGPLDAWRAGRTIVAPMSLRPPSRYLNAGLPDQARALARRGTPLVGSVKSGALIEVVSPGGWWDERAGAVRVAVRGAMRRWVAPLDAVSAGIGTAILIGDRAQLPETVSRQLQEAGTYHVVAISGGNIAMLAGAIAVLLWSVRIRFEPAAAIAALALVAHAGVIGGGASVMRATAMAAIYLALRVLDQRTAPVHAVAVAAAGLLVLNPLDIAGAGFWLTFGATGALLMAAARWPRLPGGWLGGLAAILTASAAVDVVLMPVSAFVFERVTLAGLVLNLAAVPAMGAVQAFASVCVMAEAAGAARLAEIAGLGTHLAAQVLVGSSGLVAHVPWATWRVPPPPMPLLAAYYAILAAWWVSSRPPIDSAGRRRLVRISTAALAALWCWIALAPAGWLPPAPGAPLRVVAMDVGQGDAVLVATPDGRTVMVDAGGLAAGSFDVGDRVLGPALRARGVRRLDYLAVTHGDLDHLGGAPSLLRDFGAREVWAGVPVAGHVPQEALRAAARAGRTPWRWLQRGDRLELGAVELRVHHPPLPDWERQRVRNDDSLVLEVRYGAVSVWLTGDISRAVEEELLASADPRRLNVLKAAHHGSLTSSSAEWIRRLRPVAVLISAGRGNLFGHPAPAVVRRYESAGAAVFRTDRDGQIDLVTNGTFVEISTFTGRRWRLR